jgi:O-antigen/teichoic acid export membrane protein
LDNSIIRHSAASDSLGERGRVKGVYRKAMGITLAISFTLSLFIFLTAGWFCETVFQKPALAEPMRWMSLAVVPLALFTLQANALKGLKKIVDAMLVLSVLTPAIALALLFVLVPGNGVNGAIWAYTLAAATAMAIGLYRWRNATPDLQEVEGRFPTRTLLDSNIPLFWANIMQLVMAWSSILMLGMWASVEDVGIFSIANKTALMISYILIAYNSIAAAKFAALYQQRDFRSLDRTARHSTRLMTFIAAPALLIFLLCPEIILKIFGERFVVGALALSIMAIGQFINVATGPVGILLTMSGNEMVVMNNSILAAGLNIVLNLFLIPYLGVLGAAISFAISQSIQNLLCVAYTKKRLGIVIFR